MPTPRKICIVTGSRAEYGHLFQLLKTIRADKDLQLQIIATGMHLSPEFGCTVREIEADGFGVDAKVEMLLSSDSPVGVTKSIGLGVIGFAEALDRLQPDILVVLGDRFEILAAGIAALVARIPIAHIHGGETTQGAMDEAFRHALTKMAHLHFTAAEPYRRRVIQLGEAPERVFQVGAPGLDVLSCTTFLGREELGREVGLDLTGSFFLVSYHPATLGDEDPAVTLRAVLQALEAFPEYKVLATETNADPRGRVINQILKEYAGKNSGRVVVRTSLGQQKYLSALRLAAAVVGNSSSGFIEAPALGVPTVNVGSRQEGRLRSDSVLDCPPEAEAVQRTLAKILDPSFQQEVMKQMIPAYGTEGASQKIKDILKNTDLDGIIKKTFFDVPLPLTI
jgi:UDP-N-acetylglucosamine 2-epimerase (non-hydrolysing)/GDP/UDP-N,N'-diacetylbacillosamine 2-epimerase (hydrolysing)